MSKSCHDCERSKNLCVDRVYLIQMVAIILNSVPVQYNDTHASGCAALPCSSSLHDSDALDITLVPTTLVGHDHVLPLKVLVESWHV